jgi:hypothetical protein
MKIFNSVIAFRIIGEWVQSYEKRLKGVLSFQKRYQLLTIKEIKEKKSVFILPFFSCSTHN